MSSFKETGIIPELCDKLKERAIEKPTAIQNLVIPNLLAGKNTVFRSATGTGKTFAYLLPILQLAISNEQLAANNELKILICAPTLELCAQIKEEVDFLTNVPQKTALLIGSVKIEKQIAMLKRTKPVIAVGNPGRLFTLAKMGKLKLNNLRFLILDEADRLTASEFLEETQSLLSNVQRYAEGNLRPPGSVRVAKENLCVAACSATVSAKTCTKLGPLFKDAQIIESTDHEILRERIEHWAIFSEKRRKVQTLRSLIAALKGKKNKKIKILIFTSKGDDAGKILSQLQHHKVSAAGLFGKVNKKPLTSEERKSSLDAFRSGKAEVLVCTDLAARGLDIPGITHIIALDVPEDGEVYIHRCGRTARAGKRGIMITVGDETQMRLLALLEKKLKICIYPKELYGGNILTPE